MMEQRRFFPTSTFSRMQVPVVQPPAGSLKPKPSKGHSELRGLWK